MFNSDPLEVSSSAVLPSYLLLIWLSGQNAFCCCTIPLLSVVQTQQLQVFPRESSFHSELNFPPLFMLLSAYFSWTLFCWWCFFSLSSVKVIWILLSNSVAPYHLDHFFPSSFWSGCYYSSPLCPIHLSYINCVSALFSSRGTFLSPYLITLPRSFMLSQTKLTKVNRSAFLQPLGQCKLEHLNMGFGFLSEKQYIFLPMHRMWCNYSSKRQTVTYATPTSLWYQT